MKKIILFFFVFFLFSGLAHAQQKRVGLATYEVVSDNTSSDYLKKVISESLSNTLSGQNQVVEVNELEGDLKRKGVSNFLKREKLDALVVGSVVKVGSSVEIYTRIYLAQGREPISLNANIDKLDAFLSALRTHGQRVAGELAKAPTAPIAPLVTPTPVLSKASEAPEKVKAPEKNTKSTKQEIEPTPLPEQKPVPVTGQDARIKKGGQISAAVVTPDYRWMSDLFAYEGRGMVYADLDGDGKNELVVISLKRVYVYELSQNQIRLLAMYEGNDEDNFVRVYAYDLNGDGKKEILVSDVRFAQAASLGLEYQGGNFKVLFEKSPWLLNVIDWEGKPTLIGESYIGRTIDYHHLRKLKLEGKKLKEEPEDLPLSKDIGLYGLANFQLSAQDTTPSLVYLTPSGSLKVLQWDGKKYVKKWASGDKFGGSSNFIRMDVRNFLNEVDNEFTYFNVNPSTWLESGAGAVMVPKNENFTKGMVGTRPVAKDGFFVKLVWGDLGLREVWSTKKVEGYIADQQVVQLPWEKKKQLLVLFWVRDKGFMNAMGALKTAVAIYDLD